MDADLALPLLKILAAFIAGVLGAAGILFDYRTASGQLTKAGKLVLASIALAATFGIAISALEATKNRAEKRAQSQRAESLLQEVIRVSQPITQLKVGYTVSLPSNIPSVEAYRTRISDAIEKNIEAMNVLPNSDYVGARVIGSDNGRPVLVQIDSDSDLWPSDEEEDIRVILKSYGLKVLIFRNPISLDKVREFLNPSAFEAWGFPKESPAILIDRDSRRIEAQYSVDYPKASWMSSGDLSSFMDIRGSQIILIPPNTVDYELPERLAQLIDPIASARRNVIMREMRLSRLIINFGDGRMIRLNENDLKVSKLQSGTLAFSVVLPSNEIEFRKMTSPFRVQSTQ
jgi:hypothetical protein